MIAAVTTLGVAGRIDAGRRQRLIGTLAEPRAIGTLVRSDSLTRANAPGCPLNCWPVLLSSARLSWSR
jgi:hypothetical protein